MQGFAYVNNVHNITISHNIVLRLLYNLMAVMARRTIHRRGLPGIQPEWTFLAQILTPSQVQAVHINKWLVYMCFVIYDDSIPNVHKVICCTYCIKCGQFRE